MMGPRGSLGFDERISALDECTPNMFIAVVEAILKVQVPGVYRDPTTIDGAFPAHRAADPLVSRPCLHLRPCLQCRACAPFAHALHVLHTLLHCLHSSARLLVFCSLTLACVQRMNTI